ncbi:MAG: AAA family ATPase [Methanomicrobiales archaeon]|nr:AAA family ATPase [Methanomicrobiales archaeon]
MISGSGNTSNGGEEWNNLYYQNLGLGTPETVQARVVQRLGEFKYYLENAERRMSRKSYTFTFRVHSAKGSLEPGNADERRGPFEADFLSFDPEGKDPLPEESIKANKNEVSFEENRVARTIFAHFKGQVIPFTLKVRSAVLSDIEPQDVREDEEEDALDFLSEANDLQSGKDRIKILRNLVRRESKLIVDKIPANGSFTVRYNTYTLNRQRQAIEDLAISPLKHHLPLINLVRQERDFTWGDLRPIANPKQWFVLTNENLDGTGEQRDFVQKALGTPDFAFLEGPPGSGKTTALLELIAQVIGKDGRVLMVASTHVAVDNVLERLITTMVETPSGKTNLKEACGIIPLRIGDEDNVSDLVKPFCLGNFPETERQRILKGLSSVISRKEQTPSQERLYHTLHDDPAEGRRQIETLLLSTANLICGTTLGILRAPIIKGAGHTSEALFDYVILDEASKTTFQEFLVPALYGRRWILSGDVRQLSPYVDQTPIEENLRSARTFFEHGEEDREICCAAYLASRYSRPKGSALLLRVTDEEVEECAHLARLQVEGLNRARQAEKLDPTGIIVATVPEPPRTDVDKCNLLASNLIVTKQSLLREIEPYLPPDIQCDDRSLRDLFSQEYSRRMGGFGAHPHKSQSWENEICWRIGRMHELKNIPDKRQALHQEIMMLVPYFERDGVEAKKPRNEIVIDDIETIRRIALPSVLELLQQGFETRRMVRGADQIALYSGLPANVLALRHTLLSCQHRMDPDISLLPREYVYEGQALNDAGGRDGMKEKRAWEYDRYGSRCIWMDIRPSRKGVCSERTWFNLKEVAAMKEEFERFIEWAKNHPNLGDDDGLWSVAFLSFYNGQTRQIMESLESFSHRRGIYSGFEMPTSHVKVDICTVDRFQGHEADVVFLSFVRPKWKGVGFLNNRNRLNVAATRARYQLVMFGDLKNFEASEESFLKALATESAKGPIYYGKR